MGSKKAKKDCKAKSTHTSPRKQKAGGDLEPEEDSQEPSQEPEPEAREELPEAEAAEPDGDGEKAEKASTVWTPEQDEQITTFFEKNTFFYDMGNAEYKNKKKKETMILELARSMFDNGKL